MGSVAPVAGDVIAGLSGPTMWHPGARFNGRAGLGPQVICMIDEICPVAGYSGSCNRRQGKDRTRSNGEVAEWSKAHAWKVCRRETVSRVRIPVSPPYLPCRRDIKSHDINTLRGCLIVQRVLALHMSAEDPSRKRGQTRGRACDAGHPEGFVPKTSGWMTRTSISCKMVRRPAPSSPPSAECGRLRHAHDCHPRPNETKPARPVCPLR